MREHDWKHGIWGPDEAAWRFCGNCGMHQWAIESGAWESAELVLWRMSEEERWQEMPAPECPDAPPPETEWSRVEGRSPYWSIRNPKGNGRNYLCSDEAIRTFGRRHMERLLGDLPPLPDKAWEVER